VLFQYVITKPATTSVNGMLDEASASATRRGCFVTVGNRAFSARDQLVSSAVYSVPHFLTSLLS